MERNTIIEDRPQVSIKRAMQTGEFCMVSPSFATPKGTMAFMLEEHEPVSPSTSDTQSEQSSTFSRRSRQSDFDELYDVTESESEGEVPIRLSHSVKKRVGGARSKYPSIVIPPPSEWPTIEKMKSAITPLSPPPKIEVPKPVLAQLQHLRVPSDSATPSLDGNTTDEDISGSSCPSTPDIEGQENDHQQWEAPIQLDPRSFSLLEHITLDEAPEPVETVIEVSEEAIQEMRMIVESPPITARISLQTHEIPPPESLNPEDELSALSVPSPGGFFASLDSTVARKTWSMPEATLNTSVATEFYGVPWREEERPTMPEPSALPTSTATSFYGVPWRERPDNAVEHVVETVEPEPETEKADPVTALRVAFSPTEVVAEVDEISATYNNKIQESASEHLDRTKLWLSAQTDYMRALCEECDVVESFKDIADAIPKTPEQESPPAIVGPSPNGSLGTSPSKKSVRFADGVVDAVAMKSPETQKKRISPIHDGTFWEGWRHQKRSQRARDVFNHRQVRAEADHVKRTSCQQMHLDQLHGKFELKDTSRPAPSRPVSNFLPVVTDEQKTVQIQQAERERQALGQLQTSAWHLSAHREINGGKLLTSPEVETFKHRTDVRILDLSGQVHCSWAWQVALEHPKATVYTTVSTDAEAHVAESTLEGPENHYVVAAPKPWELPFENDYFDVISARNLYSNLRTIWPKGHAADEWDLTLRECLRCLRRGGYLEFDLLDAELIHARTVAQALGVEFAFNLKTRGYDPCSGKSFLPRLKRAGFEDIKRAWLILPVAEVLPKWTDDAKERSSEDNSVERSIGPNGEVEVFDAPLTGSTKDVRALTGLVGARMWEQWMLKLSSEMGRSEERCLESVAKALEEGGRGDAAWRCLVGWARKST